MLSMFKGSLRGKALTAVILFASGVDFLEFGYDQGLLGGMEFGLSTLKVGRC